MANVTQITVRTEEGASKTFHGRAAWKLPTRPTKTTDSRAKNFGDISVELDAIPPDRLHGLVETVIMTHLPKAVLRVLRAAEESERQWIEDWANAVEGGAA